MRTDTVIKRLRLAMEHIAAGNVMAAFKVIQDTERSLREDLERKKSKSREPEVRELIAWYRELWNNEPPELLRFSDPWKVIARHFKDLIKIYRNNNLDTDTLRYEYEAFKDANPKLIGWKKKLLGDRGIVQFRYVLPRWKGDTSGKKWTTEENERGLDHYLQKIDEPGF
ncbi:hypothetical protein Theam_0029 [Thermovibrio ammonificans HB-1]|uniref:Uncharacterized protein n=1 Tax=Thermovibrio ammonificans (strain DSM 15698 / JCM 12110 / HB-1) TaxID=648996 RepID=E8T2S8_THEA1|nr:hypothetical protein [Thermovibrio ammonificans]ADU96003.1 hypothetical protein Theam_0029 [Thermovibrio ammonificans HB-1]